jgi:hypothetical protein
MGDQRLTSPRLRIVRDGHEPVEVQTDNRDMILWERTRLRHKWPKFDEAPFVWMTFLGWAAARRTGAIETSLTYEMWESDVLGIETVSAEDTSEIGVPTEPGADPG